MRLMIILGLVLSLVGSGCGDTSSTGDELGSDVTSSSTDEAAQPGLTASVADQATSSSPSSTTTTSAAEASSTSSTTTTEEPATTVTTTPAPDPLAGRSLAEICSEYGLELIAFSFDTLQGDYADTCCVDGGLDPDSLDCQLDWPFSDVPDCSSYDDMRNAIYARYGYPFQSAEYRQRFGQYDWYVERADFDASWLTPVAEANVATLQQLRADEVGCFDYDETETETDDGE